MLRAAMGTSDHHRLSNPEPPRPPVPRPPVARHAVQAALAVALLAIGGVLGTAIAASGPGTRAAALLLDLLPLAAVLAVAAGLVGLAAGAGLGAELGRTVAAVTAAVRRRPRGAAPLPTNRIAELAPIAEAAARLERRFAAEMALYEDALAEVETLDGQRTDLLTAVASELHRPIDRVVALSERLQTGAAGPIDDATAEDARIVHNAGVRLREMVDEILDLSSLISKDVALERELLDLAAIAREVVETGRGQIGAKRLKIQVDAPDAPVPVLGHPQRLWQIVMNLMTNAIKFTDIGTVSIKVSAHAGGARLEVVDTGVGIAASDQASVFDTFKQIAMKPGRARGAGLGLAICKRLVELHRGRIVVSSIVGQGTRFTVTFPPPGGAG
jgi:signal transduction histidine kinase